MFRFRTAAVTGAVIVPLIAGGFIAQRAPGDGARLFEQVYSLVSQRFVDTVDTAVLYEKAARGLVQQLQDPYSELLSPKQVRDFTTNTAGRYGGIGMQIEQQQGKGITVSKVFPHTPAEQAGVREGDIIVAINDTISTRGWTTRQVSEALLGTPGTKVSVTFARPSVAEPIKLRLTRATIHIPAVPYAITFGKVGYIPFQQFSEQAAEEVVSAIRKVEGAGARSIILDMRTNPGGFLDQALSVSNIFLRQGQQIASVRGREGNAESYTAKERPLVPSMPVVILTDQYTASAAEIVAGALQDHDRALIVGTTSFGKGLVQSVYTLEGGYQLKLTTAKWFTPSGRSIQKERKLLASGEFVEVHPDSLETDSARKARPAFRSDAGRVVYGGGAVTPDLIVKPDTLSTPEQQFLKAIAPKLQEWYVTVYDYAYSLKDKVTPTFTVQPAWRDELFNRLKQKAVPVERTQYDAASDYVDFELKRYVARLAFGDSVAKRVTLNEDAQLRRAIEILQKGQTQQELFAIAAAARK